MNTDEGLKESKPSSRVKHVHVKEIEKARFQKQLFESVLIRDKERVIELINAGADVNATDNEGKTALFYAVQERNNESVVRALVDAGADVNKTDDEGKTALFYAVQVRDNERVVHALVDGGVDINRTDNEGKTALMYPIQGNNESVVHVLLSLTSVRDIYGRTPLFYAVTRESQSIVCDLLEKKVNMRIKDNGGMNFLSFFVDHCISKPADSQDEAFIRDRLGLLEQKGVKNNTVYKAIIDIIFCKCPLLLYSGINVPVFILFLELAKTYDKENENEIDDVLKKARKIVNDKTLCSDLVPQILDLLCELGADPNSADTNGNTALHHAACLPFHGVSSKATIDLLHKLEEEGVTVDVKNHQSETPLLSCLTLHCTKPQLLDESNHLSSIKELEEVCQFLIENGSNVEETTKNGNSVLHLIMRLLQQILERNGNTDLKDAVQVGTEIFILFSSTKASRRVANNKDENLNSPLHLWASLELPCTNSGDQADGRSAFLDFMEEILKKLVECGAHLEERNKHGQTPLHLCRTWTAVNLLLGAGAKPDVVDSSECSPLLVAVQNKTLLKTKDTSFYPDITLDPKEFLEIAIEKGLDLWMVDEHGNSVLSSLIDSEVVDLSKAMIDVFCANKKDFPSGDKNTIACSILNILCQDNKPTHAHWKQEYVAKILKSLEKPLSEIKWRKTSPLHLCCRNIVEAPRGGSSIQSTVHWDIAQQLLSYGADCTISDETGQSCFDIAEKCPELKYLLNNHFKDYSCIRCWIPVSERYKHILEKVARKQESTHVKPFWYNKVHLGEGSFGLIFAGINEVDGREVAIKRIEKLRMQRAQDRREIRTLAALAHCDQVVQYLCFFEDEHFSYIVLELMEGNLNEFLSDNSIALNSDPFCKDLLKGIQYLHGLDILHRDLKPSNILYKTVPKLSLKIADFGLSHSTVGSTSTSAYASFAGTRCWMAPELLKCTDAESKSVYSKGSDMFSCGLLLHYILSVKKHPYSPPDCNDKGALQVSNETESNILNGNMEGWDKSLCPEAEHVLKKMLDGDENKRPSAGEALDHPLFWSNKKKMDLLIAVGSQPEFGYSRTGKAVLSAIETDLEAKFVTIVNHAKWISPSFVQMNDIFKDMRKKRRYDFASVVDLIRFMRNAYAHISEETRPTPIRKLLLEDFVFLDYFPNLVMEVYKAVTTHGWDQMREQIKYAMKK